METDRIERLHNFTDGSWHSSIAEELLDVVNMASAHVLAQVPLSSAAEVDQAASAAVRAFGKWRRTPVGERIQPLFTLKSLPGERFDTLAHDALQCRVRVLA